MEEIIRYQDQWYVLAGSSRADDRTRVLKDGDTFGLFDRYGDVQRVGDSPQGLYHEGTRYLSSYELSINGSRPVLLNSSVKQDNTLLTVDLTAPHRRRNNEPSIPEGTVHLFRSKLLWQSVHYEHLRLSNFGAETVPLRLALHFDADYVDIFEVRGTRRERRGSVQQARCDGSRVRLGYVGLDGETRCTTLAFSPPPQRLGANEAAYEFTLAPQERIDLYVDVACHGAADPPERFHYDRALEQQSAKYRSATRLTAHTTSSNEQFNAWIERSAADLRMLVTDTPQGRYPYAGVPWFSTEFGRDGIITALQTLWYDPSIARGVLGFLAQTQAHEEDPVREAEPGKILHETRLGEMAALDEIPFRRYYGTVDATPLFVLLAGAYFERTGDRAFVDGLWPHVCAALEWIERYGDRDGDGFVEYQRHGERGLLQQGWKDSDDSVFHEDGRLAQGPIALCEVQGYVYGALCAGAALARVAGEHAYAGRLEQAGERLRERFDAAFWDEALGAYVLALDGEKRPCRVRSSNAGQVLFTGIAAPERAARVAVTLLDDGSFNGWGIRTLAKDERRYNPMSYHNGSVWPHDNALIALGFARYGLKQEALTVLSALFNASTAFDLHRLPELFCGFGALPGQGPTLYPVACSPQAWASGTVFLLLQAALGMRFHVEKPQLRFHYPALPEWLERVEIRNLQVGDGYLDLSCRRHTLDVGINVLRKEGDVEVAVIM